MPEPQAFCVGINENIINKPAAMTGLNQAIGWKNLELSLEQVIQHVCSGHAISAHFRSGHRKAQNFICSDMIAADVDDGLTLADAMQSDFVRQQCAFIYTSPSHTNEDHRFRLVFLLDESITDPADWANALLGIAVKMNSDRSIKDAGRQFYGNSEAQVFRFDRTLSAEQLREWSAP